MTKSALFLVGLFVTAACARNSLGSRYVMCTQEVPRAYGSVDEVPSGEWIRLLMSQDQPRHDCGGRAFDPVELPLRCANAARPGSPRDLPIRAEELGVRTLPDGFGIVSLPVEEFTNGDRTVLVAHVHTSKKALSVLGIGAVRLPPAQIDLELQMMRGEALLFARGAECRSGPDSGKCDRTLKLLLLHEGRFVPLELRDADSRCHGETVIDLARSQDVRLKSGWLRRFELVSNYEITANGLLVNEQLVATDRPPDGSEDNARLFRKSDARRLLEFTGAYFVYEQESLWLTMREVRGDLQTNKSQSYRD